MKAGVLIEPGKIQILDLPKPNPKQDELLVRLTHVGICGSDTHFFKGDRLIEEKRVIGHEAIGFIEKIGAAITDRNIGERVAIEPNIPCGNCKQCQRGRGNSCAHKRVIGLTEDGCFASYISIPTEFAHTIPDSISTEDAVCIEPMAVAYHALQNTDSKPGDAILVIGLGSIGMLLTHLALQLNYRVFTIELNSELNAKAAALGAVTLLEKETDTLKDILENENVRTIFECAGAATTAELACNIAARGTDIILLGLSEKPAQFQPLKIARENICIKGSIIYDHPHDFKNVIELIANKTIQPSIIISNFYPLEKIQEALEKTVKGHTGKIIIDIAKEHD